MTVTRDPAGTVIAAVFAAGPSYRLALERLPEASGDLLGHRPSTVGG